MCALNEVLTVASKFRLGCGRTTKSLYPSQTSLWVSTPKSEKSKELINNKRMSYRRCRLLPAPSPPPPLNKPHIRSPVYLCHYINRKLLNTSVSLFFRSLWHRFTYAVNGGSLYTYIYCYGCPKFAIIYKIIINLSSHQTLHSIHKELLALRI